ncbi:hypothetical protein [Actinomarinicola tropica]|uniref:Uncharacterized protein n=1 Tax=Actinomarinicola tropica TaxID=2789776 RepID=A0A5Q2RM97_9ACTN|nr:hypothetical protein [Actinomarinicola tropica]QGG96062.1 hypothetical protein GH723_13675 [Actinomarinicola tropica]
MGRRLAGGFLVGLGLVVASLAWICLSITRTVLDPDRSAAIAEDVYRDPEVRDQLRSSMADAIDAAVPDGVDVSRLDVVDAADRALDDPAVEALLVDGLVRAHQRFLGDDPNPDEPIVVDGAALASATRRQLVSAQPELAGVVPEIPSLAVTLPTDSIPNAGGLRDRLVAATAVLAALAAGLVVAAFVVTDNRARVLRRVGFWLIGAAAFWVIIGTALPSLAHLLLPGQAAIIGAIWGVAAGGMRQPSITAGIAGVAALALSIVWMAGSAVSRRSRRRDAVRERSARAAEEPRYVSRPVSVPADYHAPNPDYVPPPPAPTPTYVPPGEGVDATVAAPSPAVSRPAAPRWVEGVGYVDDPDATRY